MFISPKPAAIRFFFHNLSLSLWDNFLFPLKTFSISFFGFPQFEHPAKISYLSFEKTFPPLPALHLPMLVLEMKGRCKTFIFPLLQKGQSSSNSSTMKNQLLLNIFFIISLSIFSFNFLSFTSAFRIFSAFFLISVTNSSNSFTTFLRSSKFLGI